MKVKDAYENLERIIIYGFLSVRISFNGHDLLIKNITDKEYLQMQMNCSDKDKPKLNLLSLAYSTAAIDGVSLLGRRSEGIDWVIKLYKRSSALFVIKVIESMNELSQAYIDSLDFLEGFCYTPRSRYMWSVMDPYNRSSYSGMVGLDCIGINSALENWISINKKLDEENTYSREFSNTLLIVGASNYKSAKMLSQNYEKHTQELKELRDDICKYGYDRKRVEENEKKREAWTAPLSSREDLVKELYRQMTGKKDKHDIYIDQWIENQKKKADDAKKSVEDKQKAFRKKIEETDFDLLEPSKPISSYELNKALENKNKKSDNTFMAGREDGDIKDRVYKRLSAKIIRPEIKETANG